MSETEGSGLFVHKPSEIAVGRVVLTPAEQHPYKVVFRVGERTVAEHPVPTVREGEALIRRELASIQFSAQQERPDPEAPRPVHSTSSITATD